MSVRKSVPPKVTALATLPEVDEEPVPVPVVEPVPVVDPVPVVEPVPVPAAAAALVACIAFMSMMRS
jgi:hypothetical protein